MAHLKEIVAGSLEDKEMREARIPSVYVLRCENWYKIGKTRTGLVTRLNTLKTGNPYPIKVIYRCFTLKDRELEALLHEVFSERERRGEWFKLYPEDENTLDSIFESY